MGKSREVGTRRGPGPKTQIRRALDRIRAHARSEYEAHGHRSSYRGLASEGYLGGYRTALEDVMLVLDGVKPSSNWGMWEDWDK